MSSQTPKALQYQIIEKITEDLLRPIKGYSECSLNEQCYRVFDNFRVDSKTNKPKGLKLTTWGLSRLSKLYDSYTFEHDIDMKGKILIKLDNAMVWPYYVNRKKVVFFSGEDASWFKLNGTSLEEYTEIL